MVEQVLYQLVEVLREPEYADEHLPGAMNIPLKTLEADRDESRGARA